MGHNRQILSPEELLAAAVAPYPEVRVSDLTGFAQRMRPVRYAPQEPLFQPGDVCTEVVLAAHGLVRAYYIHDAREVNLRFLGPPNVATAFGSLITGAPASEWVAAVTEVVGYRVSLEVDPNRRTLAQERLFRILAEQHYLSMDRRLRMIQSKSGKERYAYFCRVMDPRIVAGMPAYHVASYLGLAPETLSRIKAQLER